MKSEWDVLFLNVAREHFLGAKDEEQEKGV